jgi:hypothetical protein
VSFKVEKTVTGGHADGSGAKTEVYRIVDIQAWDGKGAVWQLTPGGKPVQISGPAQRRYSAHPNKRRHGQGGR